MDTKMLKVIFAVLWLGVLAYLITLMLEICKPQKNAIVDNTPTTSSTADEGFENNDNTFDYSEENIENFEPNDPQDRGNSAAPSKVLLQETSSEQDDEIHVEGTDALIAASSDRFYSIDTKGQTNRNASNDLRGDLPIAYNSSYTPFNQSAIYGEPLVPTGRL